MPPALILSWVFPRNLSLSSKKYVILGVKVVANAMAEESIRETAATGEPPRNLASPEFFFLLQRIDRLDEKFTGEIRRLEDKFDKKIDSLKFWVIGAVITIAVGFAGVIVTLITSVGASTTPH